MEIVTFVPGDKADLKPGIKIFIGAAKKLPDGTLQADAADVRTVTLSSDPVEGERRFVLVDFRYTNDVFGQYSPL